MLAFSAAAELSQVYGVTIEHLFLAARDPLCSAKTAWLQAMLAQGDDHLLHKLCAP